LLMEPTPTLSPQERSGDERTLTLPGQTWYALQLGVFDTENSARQLAERFMSRGAGGYVTNDSPYRVLAAAYETRADAQAVLSQLKALHGVEAYVHEMHTDEIVVKVSGQAAQLTALEDAYDTLSQTADYLSSLSQGLDQHTMEEESIRAALRSQKNTLSALEERLQKLFGENAHAAVKEVRQMLSALSDGLTEAASAQGEVLLGARIKHCQLLCIHRLGAYAALLAK